MCGNSFKFIVAVCTAEQRKKSEPGTTKREKVERRSIWPNATAQEKEGKKTALGLFGRSKVK